MTVVAIGAGATIGLDRNGKIQSWSPGAEQLYGWPPAIAIGQDANLLTATTGKAVGADLLRRVLLGETVSVTSRHRVHSSGRILHLMLCLSPTLDINGNVCGATDWSRSIGGSSGRTETAESRVELIENSRRLTELTDGTDVGFFLRTIDPPEFIYLNKGMRDILGLDAAAADPTFAEMLDLIDPEDRASMAARGALDQNGAAQLTELRIRRPDGALRWVRISGNPVANGDSTPLRSVGTVQDVTDRKAAESVARESELQLLELTKNTDMGFFLRDPEHMLYMNPAFLRIFGIDPDGPARTVPDIMSMIHPDDRELAVEVTQGVDQGHRTRGELRLIRPSGEVRWIRATNDPVVRDGDATVRVAGTIEDITDRKQTELLLQESDERFLQLANNVEIGFNLYETDPPRLLYSNPAFSRMFGFDPAGPPPSPADSLKRLHPADRPAALAARQRVANGDRVEYDARIIRPNGQLRWIHVNFSPVERSGVAPSRAACFFEDITDRKLAEAALLESDSRFRQLAGSIDVGISLRQIEPPSYLYVNPRYVDLIGFDPTAGDGSRDEVLARIHPDDYDRVVAEYWDPSRAGQSVHSEVRIVERSGAIRWLRVTSQPIRHDGEVLRAAGTVEDITQWKESESSLRESDARFQQLAGNVKVGFLLADLTGIPEVIYVNPAFLVILGLDGAMPLPEAVASMRALIHPDDRHLTANDFDRLRTGEHIDEEIRIIRPDGNLRWLRYQRNPVMDDTGCVVRVAGTTEDVTDRKTAEAALRSAQAEAERANRAKSDFLSKMSHELRTPLNAVLGFAQLLGMDELDESQREYVGHIKRGGDHLLEMINDILDISGIESEHLETTIESVPVTDLVAETVEFVRPLAAESGITLLIAPTDVGADWSVLADRRRLRQVLLNLLANSIKYNRPGGEVTVSCRPVGSAQAQLMVTDTGQGIRPEDISRLFTPFERLGQRQSAVEGTGIGLALSQRLVAVMAGRLEAESVFGEGSTFTITLPLARSAPEQLPRHPTDGRPAGVDQGAGTAVLLYIEDNRANVDLMERVVGRRPEWTMIHTDLGGHGIALARSARPTLIILDVHLPDLNGGEVLAAIRRDPLTSGIPVVIASADAHQQQVAALRASGAADYITKPLDIARVFQLLDRFSADAAASADGGR